MKSLNIFVLIPLLVITVQAYANNDNRDYNIIHTFMVANVYFDLHGDQINPQFSTIFHKKKLGLLTVAVKPEMLIYYSPSEVKSILVEGPNGYSRKINTGINFNNFYLNGHVPYKRGMWFQVVEPKGILENGQYTVSVILESGYNSQKTTILNDENTLMGAYLDTTAPEFLPIGTMETDENYLFRPVFEWSILPENGYYNFNLAVDDSLPFIYDNIIYHSNILIRNGMPETGLNIGEQIVYKNLESDADYYWFVEVYDSNRQDSINEIIVMPLQKLQLKTKVFDDKNLGY